MTNAIQQFQKDKPIFDRWIATAMTDEFQKVITYARAAILEGESLTPDMITGVNLMATTLVSMCDTQEELPVNYSIGLVHDLQPKRNVGTPKPESKKD